MVLADWVYIIRQWEKTQNLWNSTTILYVFIQEFCSFETSKQMGEYTALVSDVSKRVQSRFIPKSRE